MFLLVLVVSFLHILSLLFPPFSRLSFAFFYLFHRFLRPSFSRFFITLCVSFASVLFVSISYICLLAKFIRFSALPFISISLSNYLAFFFRFVSRLIDFSFYVPFSWLLYTQSYSFSLAHFFLLHMQVNLPHSSCYFYLFCFNLGTFPSVRKVSNRSFLTQILSRTISCYFFHSFTHKTAAIQRLLADCLVVPSFSRLLLVGLPSSN